jgi:hypothetical protein
MVIENAYRRAQNKSDDRDFIAGVNFNDPKESQYLRRAFYWASNKSNNCSFT